MATEILVTGVADGIDFGATGLTEILQNVRTILTTVSGTVPLDRAFGVPTTPVDAPLEVAKARLTPLIIDAVQTFEPRVEVVSVTFEETEQGTLTPRVALRVAEGVIV